MFVHIIENQVLKGATIALCPKDNCMKLKLGPVTVNLKGLIETTYVAKGHFQMPIHNASLMHYLLATLNNDQGLPPFIHQFIIEAAVDNR